MSSWISYVKKYAAANGLTYKQAMSEASESYKQSKGDKPTKKAKKVVKVKAAKKEPKAKPVKAKKKSGSKVSNKNESYCGMSKVPKGKRRGTAEECFNANQVRYYGLELIDPSKFTKKSKIMTLEQKIMKLKELQFEAKGMARKMKNLKSLVELANDGKISSAEGSAAQQKIDKLLTRRPKLLEELKQADEAVKEMKKTGDNNDFAEVERLNNEARARYKKSIGQGIKGGCKLMKYYMLGEDVGKAIDNPRMISPIIEGLAKTM